MKKQNICNLEQKVILSIWLFIVKKGDTKEAKSNIEALAKVFRIKLKKKKGIDLKIAFEKFLKNDEGYRETLIILYNSL